ncbi:UDP-N-acetylglucosamine 2-epimerase (hydrolyzing), partial [Flavobacteriaceae bacterium]|nr:UDP-N-acetylglucosamine 2-epimerase (hydrolyzing) [Flavobacteriaceae bacterium]
TVNIGSRQLNRATSSEVINTSSEKSKILEAFKKLSRKVEVNNEIFGKGNSVELFLSSLESQNLWDINHQKQFNDAY